MEIAESRNFCVRRLKLTWDEIHGDPKVQQLSPSRNEADTPEAPYEGLEVDW